MVKSTVRLDKDEVKEAIREGDNAYGCRWLAVDSDGDYRIYWRDNNAQWDPWSDDANVIKIPALNPDGSGQESEDAQEMLSAMGLLETASSLMDAEDIGWVEVAEKIAAEDWEYSQGEALDWLADAFLSALNGDGTELNDPAPWGYNTDEWGMPVEASVPPFEFVYE